MSSRGVPTAKGRGHMESDRDPHTGAGENHASSCKRSTTKAASPKVDLRGLEHGLGAEEIARRLLDDGKPKHNGKNWRTRCPAHDDTEPSLDLKDGNDGCVLATCRAGCDQEAVIDAIKAK